MTTQLMVGLILFGSMLSFACLTVAGSIHVANNGKFSILTWLWVLLAFTPLTWLFEK